MALQDLTVLYLHPDHGVDILAEIKHSVNTLLAQVREVRKEPK